MLTFLRKIRRSLINTGSAGRYLIYAAGEIALVVFGILIALQINNWQEKNKQDQLEMATLQELLETLDENINRSKLAIFNHRMTRLKIKSLLDHLQMDKPYADSLESLLWYPYRGVGVHVNDSGFKLLESRGIDIISNPSLRKEIVYYFTVRMEYLRKLINQESDRQEKFRDNFRTIAGEKTNDSFTTFFGAERSKLFPFNYEQLKKDTAFHHQLLWKYTRRERMLDVWEEILIDNGNQLAMEIKKELKVLQGLVRE